MDILILKTSISTRNDFSDIDNYLSAHYDVDQCTIDLEDRDKVLRVIGSNLDLNEVISGVNSLGFECSELQD
jgi:hypothetical protein